ncbi:histone family protein [Candidatus Woesearchaeota archaeon]|nr:histone family protein [Candidatus Woesearchaeota archaeon]
MPQQRKTHIIPRAPVARILLRAGAERVSKDAVSTFSEVLQELGEQIAQKASRIARHSGRKTVHEEDIKLAAK